MNNEYSKIQIAAALFKLGALQIAALVMLASTSFAQPTTTVTLTSPGDYATLGNVYVDPYTATVGSVTDVSVICDDWSHNSYLGESWTATVIQAATVGNVSLGTPEYGNNQALYNELAWLGTQLLADPTDATTQAEVSFATWDLTYGANGTAEESPAPLSYLCSTLGGSLTNPTTCSGLTGNAATEFSATINYLNTAQMSEAGFNSNGWEILTPVAGTISPAGDGIPQEFLVYTPEPAQAALLGVDMAGVCFLVFFLRRRSARSRA